MSKKPMNKTMEALERLQESGGEALVTANLSEKALKSRWFNNLLDRFTQVDNAVKTLDLTQKKNLVRYLKREAGTHEFTVALRCPGADQCPIWSQCWFNEDPNAGQPPKGEVCPVELALMVSFTQQYAAEFGIEDGNYIDLAYLKELAALDIIERRMNIALAESEKAGLVEESFTGEFDGDKPLVMRHIAFEWDIKQQIANRKKEIHKAIVGTRYEKYKQRVAEKTKDLKDPSIAVAEKRETYEELIARHRAELNKT